MGRWWTTYLRRSVWVIHHWACDYQAWTESLPCFTHLMSLLHCPTWRGATECMLLLSAHGADSWIAGSCSLPWDWLLESIIEMENWTYMGILIFAAEAKRFFYTLLSTQSIGVTILSLSIKIRKMGMTGDVGRQSYSLPTNGSQHRLKSGNVWRLHEKKLCYPRKSNLHLRCFSLSYPT